MTDQTGQPSHRCVDAHGRPDSGLVLRCPEPSPELAATLERARQAVEVLRQSEDPELSLMAFVDAAVVRLIVDVETRYPELR